MELKYVRSESTVKPQTIEIGKTTVYLRKDIEDDIRTDSDGNKITYYVYQEAKMSLDDFNAYANQIASINAVKDVNNASNILLLLAGQDYGDMNQLIIMSAIADLYDAIAGLYDEIANLKP